MFCPKCGCQTLLSVSQKECRCDCGFHFFQNVAAAVMVAICWQDEVLVAVRARNPGKGLLDLPGGFVDPGESLEVALRRELQEELRFDMAVSHAVILVRSPIPIPMTASPTTPVTPFSPLR